MTHLATVSTTTVPDAVGAMPLALRAAGLRRAPEAGRTGGRGCGDRPVRRGTPSGNPDLAPRYGVTVRPPRCAYRAPWVAVANEPCRLHGGNGAGSRTTAGLVRPAQAGTADRCDRAARRAQHRCWRMLIIRTRVLVTTERPPPYVPPVLEARLGLALDVLASAPRRFHPLGSPEGLRPSGTLGQASGANEFGRDIVQRGAVEHLAGPDGATGGGSGTDAVKRGDGGGTWRRRWNGERAH